MAVQLVPLCQGSQKWVPLHQVACHNLGMFPLLKKVVSIALFLYVQLLRYYSMYALGTKEQSVTVKKFLSALKIFAQNECSDILSECAIRNDLKETYSSVQKRHKIKPKSPMETTQKFQKHDRCWKNFFLNVALDCLYFLNVHFIVL